MSASSHDAAIRFTALRELFGRRRLVGNYVGEIFLRTETSYSLNAQKLGAVALLRSSCAYVPEIG